MKILKRHRGASAIEFALVLPLLLAILFGIIEFALFMYNQQVITNAAREGARAAIVQGTTRLTEPEVRQVVMNYLRPPDGAGPWRLVTFNTMPGNDWPPTIGGLTKDVPIDCCTSAAYDPTDYVTVSITLSAPYLVFDGMLQLATLGAAKLPPITLSTKAVMKCE